MARRGNSDLDLHPSQIGQGNGIIVILVTGATGFLGRNLCPHLAERGYPVRALVRGTSQTGFLGELGVELVQGDIRDPGSVLDAAQGCQWMVHAAGKFRFWGRRKDFFDTNVAGTANALNAALQTGVERFVHISTVTVIGSPRRGQLLDEQVACRPCDDYQRSKLEAERLVLSTHAKTGLPVIILRPGAFYGPWGRYAFNRMFFEDPLKGLPMGIHRGKRITFPVFVPDMAGVIEAALKRGRAGEIYNVAGASLTHEQVHKTISRFAGIRAWRINPPGFLLILLARLWTLLARFTEREPYYSINMVPYVFCDWNVSSAKARRDLGFAPTPFSKGACQTVAWYRQQGIGPTKRSGRLMVRLWRQSNPSVGLTGGESTGK